MDLNIRHWVRINNQSASRNGLIVTDIIQTPEVLYRAQQYSYPKFFKMDVLCKWAWLASEMLLKESNGFCYESIPKDRIAVVLATSHGCLDVDKRYQQSINEIPSPALFVYTLSNIMLGEICIRHSFKGEQACFVNESFDVTEIYFWVNDLLQNRDMDACLCGWVNAYNDEKDVCLFWIQKGKEGILFSPTDMQRLYAL